MVWLAVPALASSSAGFGVPAVGGGFAGPARPGALGVITAPTAAVRGSAPEIALDLGFQGVDLRIQLDGWPEAYRDAEISPQPTASAVLPLGKVAFGAVFQVPYARGSVSDPEGPQRLFTTVSDLRGMEEDLVVAALPVPWLAVGAGLRIGQWRYTSGHALDTGAVLDASLAPDPALPIGDPLLEGTQLVDGVRDLGVSWEVGVSVGTSDGPELVVAFAPAWRRSGAGSLQFVPSKDLQASIDGDVRIDLTLPARLVVGGRVPLGRFSVEPTAEWIAWGRTGHTDAVVSGLVLTSSDPVLDGLLSSSGLDEGGFLDALGGESSAELDWRDVVNLDTRVSWRPTDPVELTALVAWQPSAVRSRSASPANVDFARLDLRAGAAWQATGGVRLALAVDDFVGSVRTVTDSRYSLEDPPEGTGPQPSGNGRYRLGLWRAGATVILSLPNRRGP